MTIFPFLGFVFIILSVFINNGILSIILFGMANIPVGIINVYLITYIQTTVSVEMLSRVVSVLDSFIVATIPIGGLLAGILSQVLSARNLMLINSLGTLFISLYFLYVTLKEKRTKTQKSA